MRRTRIMIRRSLMTTARAIACGSSMLFRRRCAYWARRDIASTNSNGRTQVIFSSSPVMRHASKKTTRPSIACRCETVRSRSWRIRRNPLTCSRSRRTARNSLSAPSPDNGPIERDLFVGMISGNDLHDASVPPDLTIGEVKWHEKPVIWARVADGFTNRLYLFANGATPARIALPFSVNSFDVSRNGDIAFAGGDFDHLAEIYLRTKDGAIRQLSHLQQGWGRNPARVNDHLPYEEFRRHRRRGGADEAARRAADREMAACDDRARWTIVAFYRPSTVGSRLGDRCSSGTARCCSSIRAAWTVTAGNSSKPIVPIGAAAITRI